MFIHQKSEQEKLNELAEGLENFNKKNLTPSERLKQTNPKLYYLILDFKDKNFNEFFEVVGKSSLNKCNEIELFKATCLYASKLIEKFPTEGAEASKV